MFFTFFTLSRRFAWQSEKAGVIPELLSPTDGWILIQHLLNFGSRFIGAE